MHLDHSKDLSVRINSHALPSYDPIINFVQYKDQKELDDFLDA